MAVYEIWIDMFFNNLEAIMLIDRIKKALRLTIQKMRTKVVWIVLGAFLIMPIIFGAVDLFTPDQGVHFPLEQIDIWSGLKVGLFLSGIVFILLSSMMFFLSFLESGNPKR